MKGESSSIERSKLFLAKVNYSNLSGSLDVQVSSEFCCGPPDESVQYSAGEMLSSNYVKMLTLLLWPICKLLNHSCPLANIKGTWIAAFNFWEGLLCCAQTPSRLGLLCCRGQTSDVDRDGHQAGCGELHLSGQSSPVQHWHPLETSEFRLWQELKECPFIHLFTSN